MASLETLPPDQRAVLQLVLQRGRSYEEIGRLLSISPAAVRERALHAFDALGPQTGLSAPRRALIADYLLGQLEPGPASETREAIAGAPGERAWARVVASELAPLTSGPLPEIPTAPVAAPAPAAAPPPAQSPPAPPPAPPAASGGAEPTGGETPARRFGRRAPREPKPPKAPKAPTATEPEPRIPRGEDGSRRSSRLGGMVLIGATVVVVVLVVFLLTRGSSSPTPRTGPSAAASSTATTGPAAASTTSSTSSTAAKVIASINLTPPKAGSTAAGIAEVLKEGTSDGIAIVGQHVPPNTTKPANAYAVWLYNSPNDAHLLGFVNPGVGPTGRLSTAGALPTNAARYKQLIISLETTAKPSQPGTIILAGTLPAL